MQIIRRVALALIIALTGAAFVVADFQTSYGQSRQFQKNKKKKPGFFEKLFGPRDPGPLFGKKSFKKRKKSGTSETPIETVTVVTKDAKARKVLVIGDFVAGGLAWGLDQAFANESRIAIVDRSNGGSGLVRPDSYDWNKELLGILNEVKPDIVIAAFGINDRQPMRDGKVKIPVRSDSWQATYVGRIDGLAETLKVYGRPFFWVSAPPVRATDASEDMSYLNGLYRPRVEAAGGHFVDIWSGFTNASGQYITTGPDIEGQVRALRTGDGINFTRAGRLKLSFYLERDVRRQAGIGGAIDLFTSVSNTSQIEIGPDGKKRLVGPVISLSDPLPGGSDTLAGAPPPTVYDPVSGVVVKAPAPKPAAPKEDSAQFKLVVKGEPPSIAAGRVDDFAWPPAERPKQSFVAPVEPALVPADAAGEPAGDADKAVLTPISKSSN